MRFARRGPSVLRKDLGGKPWGLLRQLRRLRLFVFLLQVPGVGCGVHFLEYSAAEGTCILVFGRKAGAMGRIL